MILSHKHKFVFIKGHKVASTSIEIALAQICGPDDIVTPITPVDEKLRFEGGGIARNYSDDPATEKVYAEAIATKPADQIGEMPRNVRFRNHMSLRQLRRAVPEAADYRVVWADRSPYEKVLSLANWRRSRLDYAAGGKLQQSTEGLTKKVQSLIDNGVVLTALNIDLYKDQNDKVVGNGWRFESLAEDMAAFYAELGVEPIGLPHAKAGLGIKAAEVKGLLKDRQIAYVNEAFVEEFETFGYPMFS